MDIVNVECQLAQAQMARYLAGDALPEDTIVQLEKHVKECPQCQQAAQDKKISLKAMLGDSFEPEPEVQSPAPSPQNLADELRAEMGLSPAELELGDPQEMIKPRSEAPAAIPVMDGPVEDIKPEPEPVHEPAPAIAQELSALESDPALAAAVAELDQEPIPAAPEPTPDPAPTPAVAETAPEAAPEEKQKKKLGLPKFTFNPAGLKVYFRKNSKPLVMGFALGAVLMGMGAFTRKPTAALGPRAIEESNASDTKAAAEKPTESAHQEQPAHDEPVHENPAPARPEPTHEGESPYRAKPSVEPTAESHAEPTHETVKPAKTEEHSAPSEAHSTPPPPSPRVQRFGIATNDGVHEAKVENGKTVVQKKPEPAPKPAAKLEAPRPRRKLRIRRPRLKKPAPKPGTGFVKVYR